MVVLGLALALLPAGRSFAGAGDGDGSGGLTGLEQACSHPNVQEKNPNCSSDPHGEGDGKGNGKGKGGGGDGGSRPAPNEAGPSMAERIAACGADANADNRPDGCDTADDDDDGVANQLDNCRSVANNAQSDGDGIGDACDPYADDSDHDGVRDSADNCADDPNPGQRDVDGDGSGDVCDGDDAGDTGSGNGVPDGFDGPYADAHGALVGAADAVVGALPNP